MHLVLNCEAPEAEHHSKADENGKCIWLWTQRIVFPEVDELAGKDPQDYTDRSRCDVSLCKKPPTDLLRYHVHQPGEPGNVAGDTESCRERKENQEHPNPIRDEGLDRSKHQSANGDPHQARCGGEVHRHRLPIA